MKIRYKNITEGILRFRAFDKDGIKKVFELKPDEEVELGGESKFGGLKKITESAGKGKKTKKKVEGDV